MRRSVGITIFAIGLLLLLAGILNVVQGFGRMPILIMLVGLLAFGLSFIPRPDPGPDAPPPMSPADRTLTVFYDPDPVFKNMRHYPRWLVALLIMVVFGVTYQLAFRHRVTPEKIANETERRMVDSGLVTPEVAAEYKEQQLKDAKSAVGSIRGVIGPLCAGFIVLTILAGLYLLCVLAFGGRINFWQALSVAAYGSLPPIVISTALNFILLYAKSAEDIDVMLGSRGYARADLGLLFKPEAHPILYVIGSFIGLFTLYGWWITVSGLHNTATKLSKASAWTIALLLWLVGLVLSVIFVALFPGVVARSGG